MCHSLEKRIFFTIIVLPLKGSITLFQIWIFFAIIFSYLELLRKKVTKINFKCFSGSSDYSSCPGRSIPFSNTPAHKVLAF